MSFSLDMRDMAVDDVLGVGAACFYRRRDGLEVTAIIVKVHYDEPPPYYTIAIDGVERSTVRSKLFPVADGVHPPEPEPEPKPEPEAEPAAGATAAAAPPPAVFRQPSAKSTAALLKLAEASPDAHELFRRIDSAGEGFISVAKLARYFETTDATNAFAKRLCKALDADDDGVVDFEEFRAAHAWAVATMRGMQAFFEAEAGPEALFDAIDADGDAAITRRELENYLRERFRVLDPQAEAGRVFAAIDRDDDGLIDKQEFCRAHGRAAAFGGGSEASTSAGGSGSLPTAEALPTLSVKDLKWHCKALSLDTSHCLEKEDFVKLLRTYT